MRAWLALPVALLLAGCEKQAPKQPVVEQEPSSLAMRTVPLESYGRATISVNGIEIDVYVADENSERAEGLMFVQKEDLAADEGMIFVFPTDQELSFWMESTLIPLDIAFLDSKGKILNIRQMQPLDRSPQPSDGPGRYAVEMREGYFAEKGVKAGDTFDLSGLEE